MKLGLRMEILARDGFRCRYCGRVAPEVVLEVDHVVPRRDGGTDGRDNLVTACRDCNGGKGTHRYAPATVEPFTKAEIEQAEMIARTMARRAEWMPNSIQTIMLLREKFPALRAVEC